MSGRKTMLSRFHSRKSVPVSTRIFVKGLMIQASIGVHPHEYEATQPIIIDVELDMADMKPVSYTHLTLPTNYSV